MNTPTTVEDSPMTLNTTISSLASGFTKSCPDAETYVHLQDYRQAFYAWNDTLIAVAATLGRDDSHLLIARVSRELANVKKGLI